MHFHRTGQYIWSQLCITGKVHYCYIEQLCHLCVGWCCSTPKTQFLHMHIGCVISLWSVWPLGQVQMGQVALGHMHAGLRLPGNRACALGTCTAALQHTMDASRAAMCSTSCQRKPAHVAPTAWA